MLWMVDSDMFPFAMTLMESHVRTPAISVVCTDLKEEGSVHCCCGSVIVLCSPISARPPPGELPAGGPDLGHRRVHRSWGAGGRGVATPPAPHGGLPARPAPSQDGAAHYTGGRGYCRMVGGVSTQRHSRP